MEATLRRVQGLVPAGCPITVCLVFDGSGHYEVWDAANQVLYRGEATEVERFVTAYGQTWQGRQPWTCGHCGALNAVSNWKCFDCAWLRPSWGEQECDAQPAE